MADFPTSIYNPRTKNNKSGVVYNPANDDIGYAEDVVFLDDEVVAIETFLDGFPTDTLADVVDGLNTRIDDVEADLTARLPKVLYSTNLSETKINNSTSDQDFTKIYTIPANTIKAGTYLRLSLPVVEIAGTSSATFLFYLKLGSTKVFSTPTQNITDNITNPILLDFVILGTASPSNSSAVEIFPNNGRLGVTTTTLGYTYNLDTDSNLDITLGVAFSATGSTESAILKGACLELLS